jgi:hypothetical protein
MPDLRRTDSFCRKLAAKLNPARVRRGIVSAFVTNIRPVDHIKAAFDTLALNENRPRQNGSSAGFDTSVRGQKSCHNRQP